MKTSAIGRSVVTMLVLCFSGLCIADEPAQLVGEWAVVRMERRGKAVNEASWKGMRWTFAEDTLQLLPGGSTPAGLSGRPPLKCSYAVDDTVTPHHFNWTMGTGDKAKKIKAIYELNGDAFKVSFAKGGTERPKGFGTKGTESVVYEFKRTKAN